MCERGRSDVRCVRQQFRADDSGGAERRGIGGCRSVADACNLLTSGEIAGIIGNAVQDGTGQTQADCTWAADPEETSVSVLRTTAGTQSICTGALEADDAQEPVTGLAFPAFWTWVDASGGVGTLSLCTQTDLVTVTVTAGLSNPPDEAALRTQAEQLAVIIAPRV